MEGKGRDCFALTWVYPSALHPWFAGKCRQACVLQERVGPGMSEPLLYPGAQHSVKLSVQCQLAHPPGLVVGESGKVFYSLPELRKDSIRALNALDLEESQLVAGERGVGWKAG